MAEQIISRADICERAREAFTMGRGRDSHNMNWHATALKTWLAEYDRLQAIADQSGAGATPPRSHIVAPMRRYLDVRQAGA